MPPRWRESAGQERRSSFPLMNPLRLGALAGGFIGSRQDAKTQRRSPTTTTLPALRSLPLRPCASAEVPFDASAVARERRAGSKEFLPSHESLASWRLGGRIPWLPPRRQDAKEKPHHAMACPTKNQGHQPACKKDGPGRRLRDGRYDRRLHPTFPMPVVTSGVKHRRNDHSLFLLNSLVDHSIRKPLRVTPAEVLAGMTAGIEQRIQSQRVEDLNHCPAKLGAQSLLPHIIPHAAASVTSSST